MMLDAILSVMTSADLDIWIAQHSRTAPAARRYVTAPSVGRGQTSSLTESQIQFIRDNTSIIKRRDLAAMFNISPSYVSNIVAGRNGRKPALLILSSPEDA